MPEQIKFTTTLIPLNVINGNGRIYTDNENLRSQISKFNEKLAYGELYREEEDKSVINIEDISHTIENIRIENDEVIGDITILNTPKGKILKDIYDGVVFRPKSKGYVHDKYVTITELISFEAIPKENDAFLERKKIKPRIFTELDPYGEEDWDE